MGVGGFGHLPWASVPNLNTLPAPMSLHPSLESLSSHRLRLEPQISLCPSLKQLSSLWPGLKTPSSPCPPGASLELEHWSRSFQKH